MENTIETTEVTLKGELKEIIEDNGTKILKITESEKIAEPVIHEFTEESLLASKEAVLEEIRVKQATLAEIEGHLSYFN